MKSKSSTVSAIAEVALFSSIGFVLDELQGIIGKGAFVNGGSIGFAMIAVIIIGYRRGIIPALLTGLIMGLLDAATGASIVHPAQVFLDYILPYFFVAFGCIFKPWFDKANQKQRIWILVLSTIIGGLFKFLSHYLSGVIFYADQSGFVWGLNGLSPYLYSFIYNIAFMGPTIVLSSLILVVMELKAPQIFIPRNASIDEEKDARDMRWLQYVVVTILTAAGMFLFIYFLIKYIRSFEYSSSEYNFNSDSMVIFIGGLLLLSYSGYTIYRIVKNKFSGFKILLFLETLDIYFLIYGTARLIRMYVKNKSPTDYWIWFSITLFVLLVISAALIYQYRKNKNNKQVEEASI